MTSPWDDDPKEKARSLLFDDVLRGTLSPEEAEKVAANKGLGALNPPPEPWFYEAHDPIRKPWWSLGMTVAWIAWQDLHRVREADSEFRAGFRDWFPVRWRGPGRAGKIVFYNGWQLVARSDATIQYLELVELAEQMDAFKKPPPLFSIREAQRVLWAAASEESIVGTAVRVRDGNVMEIPSYEWSHLEPSDCRGKQVLRLRHTYDAATYESMQFLRAKVMDKWGHNAVPLTHADEPQNMEDAIRSVIKTRWPNGLPSRAKLRAKERDRLIIEDMEENDWRLPPESSRRRQIQRAIKKLARDAGDKRDKRDK